MKKILLAASLAAASFALNVSAQEPKNPWRRDKAAPAEEKRVKDMVAYTLKDPDSAKFRNFYKLTRDNNDDYFCGDLNAKNSYGAYNGFVRFMVDNKNRVTMSTDPFETKLVDLVCDKMAAAK